VFRWLIAHDKVDEAQRIFAKYHAGGDESAALVRWEVTEIQDTIRIESANQRSFKMRELFRGAANRRRALISICMGIFAQWAGNGIVSYYLTLILDAVGITSTQEQTLINGILQIVNLVAAICASFLVDRLGRRPLFFWSNAGMLVSYIILTAGSATFAEKGDKNVGIMVVAFVIIYMIHYDVAYTPFLVSYPAEIWPYHLRSSGLSLTMVTTMLALFFNLFVNPIALDNISWRYYIVYVVILVIMFIVTYFLFPETKGFSLEEINNVFEGKKTTVPDAAVPDAAVRDTEKENIEMLE
jgi:MFS family permease